MNKWTWLLVLLTIGNSAYASVGSITEQVNKPATIQRNKEALPGTKGAGVEMNDAIKTTQGKVSITFEDDTKLQVNDNSKVVIDDFVYDPNSGAGKVSAKIALGTVRYASGVIAHKNPRNVSLKTPTATIAVRGTDFTSTVDELGASTIILLPSCPNDRPTRTVHDIETNCVTGEIEVSTDAGSVVLNKPFQVTRVNNSNQSPTKPAILNLSEMAISNLLIVSPPPEVKRAVAEQSKTINYLDVNFLDKEELQNVLDAQQAMFYQNKLEQEFLNNDFLASLFDMINNLLDENLLGEVDPVLPDYKKSSGITVYKDAINIELCRDNGSDKQCVMTPLEQNSTVYQTQGPLEFKNRINNGGNTIITVIQR